MAISELKINEQSIKTELKSYKNKPYDCLFEYIWNSFDAGATEIKINFDLPVEGIGYVKNVRINDNGIGWDFDNDAITNNFISSTKNPNKDKTLPKGRYGRGRYTFIWIAKRIEVFSKGKKLTLKHNTDIEKDTVEFNNSGTQINFMEITESFSSLLLATDKLYEEILLNFGWFLFENKKYKIFINEEEIDVLKNIKSKKELDKSFFPDDVKEKLKDNFEVRIVLWEKKPSEFSKFYFLDDDEKEIIKQNTSLNKKSDNFWHSVYIKSDLFNSHDKIENEDNEQKSLDFNERETQRIKRKVIQKIIEELISIRKPYLKKQSDYLLKELKEDKLIPNLPEFGIFDEESYDDLLKTIYTITPSLFVGKSNAEKKFMCATFAGLLSNQDNNLIKVVLEQLSELTAEEKKDLTDILSRTSLSHIIKTTKEIDHRLEVLSKLKFLISEYEKETLEVKHLQKILDQNFWIFGEQFRLFSTTEGALKNVLVKYAKEILAIDDPELETQPNGEVDLFLTKSEAMGESYHKNIIVEIKRASKKLSQDNEYKQIDDYRKKILEQNLCNGENQYWEFYLIGKDYDDDIAELIENAKQHGEIEKGLSLNIKNGRVKIYVRKWSDILEVEWGSKMKYLRDKLQIQAKTSSVENVDKIVEHIIK